MFYYCTIMTEKCQICQKEAKKAGKWIKLRGQYNPGGQRKHRPNLTWLKTGGQRLKVCVRCLKKNSSSN